MKLTLVILPQFGNPPQLPKLLQSTNEIGMLTVAVAIMELLGSYSLIYFKGITHQK